MINIDYTYPDWHELVKKYKDEINLFIAAQIQTNRGQMFDAEGAHNGKKKWAPLKLRSGMILSNRGNLRRSWSPSNPTGKPGTDGIVRFKEDIIVVGTNVAYARLMNDGTAMMPGGVLKAVNAKALKIPIPAGKAASVASIKIRGQAANAELKELGKSLRKAKNHKQKMAILDKMEKVTKKIVAGTGGENFIFRKSVKIPARPMDNWSQEDENELSAALKNKLVEVMNRG